MDLPPLQPYTARLHACALADPVGATASALAAQLDRSWALRRVAVAAGSRGIDRYAEVVRAVVATLRAAGAEPFVVPAMGSHGGATEAGQAAVLASLGIDERSVGAPMLASLEVDDVGATASGARVFTARTARSADAVVLVNRVKPHTDFASERLGSGLIKMAAVGLGKVAGARACHEAARLVGYETALRETASVAIAHLPPLLGIALVEDGYHRLASVEVLPSAELERREPELLARARGWMPGLPFAELDLLIVDEMGKDLSGTGMDTNVVGRGVDGQPMPGARTRVRSLFARGLSAGTHGNAVGVGLADVVRTRLAAALDPRSTYANALSALHPAIARLPMHFPSDRECLEAALRLAGVAPSGARVVRVRNTLALDRLLVSTTLTEQSAHAGLEARGEPRAWLFDAAGDLDDGDLRPAPGA